MPDMFYNSTNNPPARPDLFGLRNPYTKHGSCCIVASGLGAWLGYAITSNLPPGHIALPHGLIWPAMLAGSLGFIFGFQYSRQSRVMLTLYCFFLGLLACQMLFCIAGSSPYPVGPTKDRAYSYLLSVAIIFGPPAVLFSPWASAVFTFCRAQLARGGRQ